MQIDLLAELRSAVARVRQPHLDRLVALGIAPTTIAAMGMSCIPFGICKITELPGGLYEPSPGEGCDWLIQGVYEEGAIVDLLAWRTSEPTDWRWRLGNGWALNADALLPSFDNPPLVVHDTLLDWWRSDCDGLVILNWASLEVRRLIMCDTIDARPATGRRIIKCLSRPLRLPRIIERRHLRVA